MNHNQARSRTGAFGTAVMLSAVLLSGCHNNEPTDAGAANTIHNPKPPSTEPAEDSVVASVNGMDIRRADLVRPLINAYGLNMLLNLVQLNLAKQQAAHLGALVKPEDIQRERDTMLGSMFADAGPSEYDQLLSEYLQQQHVSRDDFDLIVESNAYLRKMVEPSLAGQITDAMVHQAYGQMYGEKREIRDIELANMHEVGQALQKIRDGKPFGLVARTMSRDARTRDLEGLIPPFSMKSPNVPQQLRDAAFAMKEGEVSDMLSTGDTYHVIKLEQIIAPKVVKFEDVQASVRQTLENQWMQLAIGGARNQLGQLALRSLQIHDPVLQAQWKAKIDQTRQKTQDREAIRQDLANHHEATTQPGTSSTNPTTTATTQPQ